MSRNHRKRLNGGPWTYTPSKDLLYQMVQVCAETGCHLWTGKPNHNGYGRIGIGRKDYLVHRVSYELQVGPIPDGLYVCHKCDVRLCLNPEHLFVGTPKDNLHDMMRKGRACPSENKHNAKLNNQQVREIRSASQSSRTLAEIYSVSPKLIRNIKSGRAWRSVQ